MEETEFIWHEGELVPWKKATVHVMSHALHYASSVFEGIRVYDTKDGPAFLCLGSHLKRLYDSARIYRMEMPMPQKELEAICHQVISATNSVRPLVARMPCEGKSLEQFGFIRIWRRFMRPYPRSVCKGSEVGETVSIRLGNRQARVKTHEETFPPMSLCRLVRLLW